MAESSAVKTTIVGLFLGAWSLVAVAQDSPAVEAAKADARRIGERQCEHALIMQRINKSQPGTPERIKAEKERKKRAEEVKKVPETTLAEAIEALKRARITLYIVVSGEGRDEEPYGMLRKAAELSGGSFMTSSAPPEIDGRCLELAEELLHQYLIGFLPEVTERTGWRTIEIKVRRADVLVRARKGYSTG